MCPAYRQESNVSPTSNVETFVAMRLLIDNWRWAGVPFYLRGKNLPLSASEAYAYSSAQFPTSSLLPSVASTWMPMP